MDKTQTKSPDTLLHQINISSFDDIYKKAADNARSRFSGMQGQEKEEFEKECARYKRKTKK